MSPCPDHDHCITCSDAAVPMRVDSLAGHPDSGLALCDGVTVDVTLVAPVRPGDRILVHAGAALVRLDGEEVQ
jgi:hydrogenase maturation factor